MTIVERITADMIASQKSGESEKLATLRLVVNALKNQAKDLRKEALSDDEAIPVIQKEVKKRKESIDAFDTAGRSDLADKERAELGLIQQYTPAELTDDEIKKLITSIVSEQSIAPPYDFGRLMGTVMKEVSGRADGQRVRSLVQDFVSAK